MQIKVKVLKDITIYDKDFNKIELKVGQIVELEERIVNQLEQGEKFAYVTRDLDYQEIETKTIIINPTKENCLTNSHIKIAKE